MNLVIKQSTNQTENLSSNSVVEKLYQMTKPDPVTGEPSANAVLVGRLQVPSAYEDAVNFLNTQFSADNSGNGSDFQITVLNNNYYIRFADEEVVRVLTEKGVIVDEGLTIAQAAQVSIGQATSPGSAIFFKNKVIETFDEFKYFTRWNTRLTDIYGMFQECTNLISIDLTNVVRLAFNFCRGCTSLTHFHGIDSQEGVLELTELITPNDNPHNSFSDCTGLKVVKSLGNLTKMLACLFQNCSNLTTVYQSVLDTFTQCTNINGAYSAFNGCSKLENFVQDDGTITSVLSLPNLTGTLGESSFKGCAKITGISSLGSITSIGSSAFENCTSLANINFPSTLTSVGNNAFNNTAWYNSQPNGEVIIGSCLYKYKGILTGSYSVPNGITYITAGAYADTGITSLTIPDMVTYIGNEAFVRCHNLVSVNFGNGVVTLDGNVFVNCTSLTSITLPDSLVNLNGQTFRGCSALETLVIGSGVNSIDAGKFNGCSALSSIAVSSNNTTYDSRDNCNAVIKSSTNELVLGCKNTAIPNTVTKLGERSFNDVSNLTSIVIPNSVTSIGSAAFFGCAGLTSITVKATNPPTLGKNAFDKTNNCPIYVPSGSVSAYQSASGWSTYADRIQAIPTT